jgi:hypothetical protein
MRPLGDSEFSNSATDANPFPGSGSSSSGLHSSPAASSRFSVSGKRVVVTGAARGIGEYTARLYAAEGAEVLVVDHPAMEEHTKRLAVEANSVTFPDYYHAFIYILTSLLSVSPLQI